VQHKGTGGIGIVIEVIGLLNRIVALSFSSTISTSLWKSK